MELGDEAVVEAIEHVLGILGFADRTVVVVNKSMSEDSDPAIIRDEIDRRLGRHAAVPVLATDAQSFLDTISGEIPSDDYESIQTLKECSGIDELSRAISEMVAQHGTSARVVAQSRQGARVADEALNRLVPDEAEQIATDQLDEFEAAIHDATDRLDRLAGAHLSRMESDIAAIADWVLAEPTLSDAGHDSAWEAACQPASALGAEATKVLFELAETLGGIAVALDLNARAGAPAKPNSGSRRSQAGSRPLGTRVLGAMGIDAGFVADAVAKAGKKVAKEGAGKESLAYELARKFQPKKVFRPHGRLKDARKIQQGANVLGKANFVIPALEEIWSWVKEDRDRRAVERSKKEVRQRYADAARAEREQVRSEFDQWRREELAPYEEMLRAGRAPVEAVANEREKACQAITTLRDDLLGGLASTATD